MDPWLTNKDGKQEAKEDDDEHEAEQHVNPIGADEKAGRRARRPNQDIHPNGWTRRMSRGDGRLTHARQCIIIRP